MNNKVTRFILITVIVIMLVICSFGGGLVVDHFLLSRGGSLSGLLDTGQGQPTGDQGGTPQDLQTLFTPFWQAWQVVHESYVDQPVDDTKLMEGAIRGMMDSLGDEHTIYMNPQEYKDITTQLEGTYAGIGAYVDTEGEFLTITRPIANSPAEAANLLPGDKIIAVDGVDMTGVTPEAVRQKVLGPAGTDVVLTIQRGDQEPFDVKITRAVINIPSVESRMLEGKIGYIAIYQFTSTTSNDLHSQLEDIMAQNPTGLIIDLRDNGGGYLDAAINVASEFIPSGVVVYEKYGDGRKVPYEVVPGGLATDSNVPLVVLVNGYSASASEILAGAIQDTGRGKLLGETTYGKGTVQNLLPLSNNEGGVKVTIARWLTPHERTIEKLGLTPDVNVPMTEEDYKAGVDPQLDAAIELIQQQ